VTDTERAARRPRSTEIGDGRGGGAPAFGCLFLDRILWVQSAL